MKENEESPNKTEQAENLPVPVSKDESTIEVITNRGVQLVTKESIRKSLASVRDGRYVKIADGIMQCYDPKTEKTCPLAFKTEVNPRTGEEKRIPLCPYFKEEAVSCAITKRVYFQILNERIAVDNLEPDNELDDLIVLAKGELYTSREYEIMKYGAPGTATLAWLKILKELIEAYNSSKKAKKGGSAGGPNYDIAMILKERHEKTTTTKKDGTTEHTEVIERTIENPSEEDLANAKKE
jgi:hypothetical protein